MSLPSGGLIEARDEEERAALIEAGRLLFARPCTFFTAAQGLDHLPPPDGIEVALAGRSNVGKSSLMNALTGQKALARVSVTPGRTKQLNFFKKFNAAEITFVHFRINQAKFLHYYFCENICKFICYRLMD